MRVLMPLPDRDFDPSEAGITYRVLREAGHDVAFATPAGGAAVADDVMVTGVGLDPWGLIPGAREVRILGRILAATPEARGAYEGMRRDPAYERPLSYAGLEVERFDGLVLPGGHRAAGMKGYLESRVLQEFVGAFFETNRPVAAICHGVLLAARSRSPKTGRSALFGRKTTALTWALERAAAGIGRIARFWDPLYYRTYVEEPGEPVGYRSVQAEVTRELAHPGDFQSPTIADRFYAEATNSRLRDSDADLRPAFVVRDGSYVSARWPGDVHLFAQTFARLL